MAEADRIPAEPIGIMRKAVTSYGLGGVCLLPDLTTSAEDDPNREELSNLEILRIDGNEVVMKCRIKCPAKTYCGFASNMPERRKIYLLKRRNGSGIR